ncbi:hypothetical protein I3842_01G286100 [Carya illinoinensis]|uniref:Uncharacterized protein n=1 Tax=Carya illinoinensis TaxID=32201 RepID=A0A922KCB8_CARIL|nr:hypothetical protein I3842_01G286100 [Carya illinoinensis]KAG6734769.1 hypothetical protein I3842_01G286100 [Carya illinoinensis]
MSSSFSPSRSPGSSRLQLGGVGGVSRLRSSSLKKPPEPLRRAVSDCLSSSSSFSSSASSASTPHHGGTSAVLVSEASRNLRDYLAAPATTDLAYNVILEHTIAERERSPAVVARCVALLKRHLLRYKPSEETLLQIDRFCVSTIAECDTSPNQRLLPSSRSLDQQAGASVAPSNTSPLPVSSFASEALVKSLNYVRSLVAKHIPKRSFQPAAFAGAPSTSRQPLPTLSSLLSKSFNSQLSPATGGEYLEKKDATDVSIANLPIIENVDELVDDVYIADDVLKWRWLGDHHSSSFLAESDRAVNPQGMRKCNFLEVGAASLLVGDMEAKIKGQPWKFLGTADMPYLDQLLQLSPVTTVTNSVYARPHLRAITASKRTKPGPRQIWEESPVSTFRPKARPLFQYRHYRYVFDSGTAGPLTLSMLEEMLSSPKAACRARAFDLILNLGVHGHLLEPIITDTAATIVEEYSQESYFDNEGPLTIHGKGEEDSIKKMDAFSAIDNFESWILNILYEILLLLVQREENEESVWASALSCLLYFVCDRGKILKNRLNGLDIRVVKALLETSRKNSWAEVVHCKLICMLTNMFYDVSDEPSEVNPSTPTFLIGQVDLIGGIEFVFLEYSLANSREERRNLYLVLFDYVLHQTNETCIAAGDNEYTHDEIQPLAVLLILADAPEAFYISVTLGVEGIGEILRRSISSMLSKYPNSERLHMLLEVVADKLDTIVSSFTHVDKEFSHKIQITKSYKFLGSIEDIVPRNGVGMGAKLSWTNLHSLLHSERIAYRRNGYIWLGDLLIEEISEKRDDGVWSNIKNLHQKIALAGLHDSSTASDVPLAIWLLCGLLKSKHNFIRWGFLFVLERLLMRCKFLLDENKIQYPSSTEQGNVDKDSHLENANAVIDIMSSALSLVFQINETDRINILKMCDILFSQLCLRVPPATAMPYGDDVHQDNLMKEADVRSNNPLDNETASMAALLLRGHAIVPMQLVARVPAALFYWPLIQLAGAATDNIALGIAVGSKGRGNLPGATSDIRATLLLLLIGKCTADPAAFQEVGGEEFFRELLDDTDSRVAYYSSAFLLKQMMTEKPEEYQHMLQNLVVRAQQSNNEKLLENPYLQMRGILQLANDFGSGL